MPSELMRKFTDLIRDRRPAVPPPVPERRRQMEETQAKLKIPADIESADTSVGGRKARWVQAPESQAGQALLYLHGGGYVQGSLDTHHELMGRLARAGRCRVLGLDYRLAPEEPFPAAVDDVLASYRDLLAQGLEPSQLILGGDSAGGGLALAALLAMRDAGADGGGSLPLPAGAVLISPWTDLTCSGESVQSKAAADPMINGEHLRETARLYHGDHDPADPRISPVFGRFAGLPPLLIQVGECEVLLDDAIRVAERAQAEGVEVSLRIWEGAFHVFQSMPQLPEAAEALEEIGRFLRSRAGA